MIKLSVVILVLTAAAAGIIAGLTAADHRGHKTAASTTVSTLVRPTACQIAVKAAHDTPTKVDDTAGNGAKYKAIVTACPNMSDLIQALKPYGSPGVDLDGGAAALRNAACAVAFGPLCENG